MTDLGADLPGWLWPIAALLLSIWIREFLPFNKDRPNGVALVQPLQRQNLSFATR